MYWLRAGDRVRDGLHAPSYDDILLIEFRARLA